MNVSGSDGNLYFEPSEGTRTGSMYKTTWVSWNDTEFDDDGETNNEPGILFDTSNNVYWADIRWVEAHIVSGSELVDTYDSSNNQSCIWVYELSNEQKTTIESDAQFVSKLVDSSL